MDLRAVGLLTAQAADLRAEAAAADGLTASQRRGTEVVLRADRPAVQAGRQAVLLLFRLAK